MKWTLKISHRSIAAMPFWMASQLETLCEMKGYTSISVEGRDYMFLHGEGDIPRLLNSVKEPTR